MLSTTRFPLPSIWQTGLAVPLSSTDPVVLPYHVEVATGPVGCIGGDGGGGEGGGEGDGDSGKREGGGGGGGLGKGGVGRDGGGGEGGNVEPVAYTS